MATNEYPSVGNKYVSIVELIIYIPTFLLAFFLMFRLGLTKTSAWIYTIVLCLLRIIGSILQLISINNPSQGLDEGVLICEFVGLSPLLFTTLGLLSRLLYWINARRSKELVGRIWYWIIHSAITAAAALCIAGGVSNESFDPSTEIKAGVLVYLGSFVAVAALFGVVATQRQLVPRRESRLFLAVGIALPLIAVRVLYSIIVEFGNDKNFSPVGGSVGILVGMSIVEEMIVAIVYVIVGYTLQKVKEQELVERVANNEPLTPRRAV